VLTLPPTDEQPDGTYRTRLLGILHTGVIYAKSDHNLMKAVKRLCAARGDSIETHNLLLANQHTFLDLPFVRWAESQMLAARQPFFENLTNARDYLEDHYADAHEKKAPRIAARNELHDHGGIAHRVYAARDGCVAGKVKPNEIAKFAKVPRLFVDLGVSASLQGMGHAKTLKQSDTVPRTWHGVTSVFISAPTPEALKEVFANLMQPPGRGYFCFFSDDSCLSLIDSLGQTHIWNIDISSCDSSHGPALFKSMARTIPAAHLDDHRVLTDQLKLPITLKSYGKVDGHRPKVVLQSTVEQLYSGSTLTTAINNHACVILYLAFLLFSLTHVGNITTADIVEWARCCGYIITATECHKPGDIQFLKHSPVEMEDGSFDAVLNLGVLLRAYGTAHGDVPGRARESLHTRATVFNKALLSGMYPRTSCPLFDLLRSHKHESASSHLLKRVETVVAKRLAFKSYTTTESQVSSNHTHSMHRMLERYQTETKEVNGVLTVTQCFNDGDIALFTESYGRLQLGEFWTCVVSDTILRRDYELACQTSPTHHVFENLRPR
jgi:hypothetical protein